MRAAKKSSNVKEYPSIETRIFPGVPMHVFDKLDGSCIRAEWSKKKGFWKFGSRTRLLGTDQEFIHTSEGLIQTKYAQDMHDIFVKQRYDRVTCFFEFFGSNSFAGTHQDESHDVVLFDVSVYRKGMVPAKEFIKLFGNLHIPDVLYHGTINVDFIHQVRNGELTGVTFEGVVCKGAPKGHKFQMTKIKSGAWLDKLREFCGNDQQLFRRLV